jgi:hypothetical protein
MHKRVNESTKWILAASFAIAAAGFLVPLWPLSVLGILIAAGSGRYIAAIFIGLLLDVAYGAPIGHLHYLYVPFTILAVITSGLRYYLSSYFREQSPDIL